MAKTKNPSSFALAWGRQLKLHREAAGLTQEALGEKVGYSRSTIASLETGSFQPGEEIAEACDRGAEANGHLIQLRQDLVAIEIVEPWFQDWLGIEREAKVIRGSAFVLVPGLLQTTGYARAVLEDDDDAVAARMARKAIFDREKPPTIRYILDQQALERPVGGPEVMAEQMAYLEELVTSRRVHIQICPSAAVPSANSSFVLATVEGTTLGYLEAETRGFVLSQREDVLDLEAVYEKLLAESLPSAASLDLIRRMKEQWTT
ncbi:helix-turn-helix domain-containing protein [Flindersiella endophytica]